MKFLYAVGMFALLGYVSADRGGSREGGGGDSSEFGFGSSEEGGRCSCQTSRRYNSPSICTGATATQVIGCPNTNSFRQCSGTACLVVACSTGQVWNYVKNACSTCEAGKHVSADLQTCVCDQGFTLDTLTQACVKCPSGSINEIDRCYCPSNLARDYTNNACKACPVGTIIRSGKCVPNDPTLFFNPITWTPSSCPGTLIPPRRGYGRSSCVCTGVNQIFYQRNFSCFTCPAGTAASRENDECECARYSGQKFDHTSGACVCKFGYTLNASGVCILNPPLTP